MNCNEQQAELKKVVDRSFLVNFCAHKKLSTHFCAHKKNCQHRLYRTVLSVLWSQQSDNEQKLRSFFSDCFFKEIYGCLALFGFCPNLYAIKISFLQLSVQLQEQETKNPLSYLQKKSCRLFIFYKAEKIAFLCCSNTRGGQTSIKSKWLKTAILSNSPNSGQTLWSQLGNIGCTISGHLRGAVSKAFA